MMGLAHIADPIGLNGGYNLNTYVNGDPVSYIDPDGGIGLLGAVVGASLEIGKEMLSRARGARCVDIGAVLTSASFGAGSPGLLSVGNSAIGKACRQHRPGSDSKNLPYGRV